MTCDQLVKRGLGYFAIDWVKLGRASWTPFPASSISRHAIIIGDIVRDDGN